MILPVKVKGLIAAGARVLKMCSSAAGITSPVCVCVCVCVFHFDFILPLSDVYGL